MPRWRGASIGCRSIRYHCAERRWGAHEPEELATCADGADKRAWYEAQQRLRNQPDRTYDVRMGFSLADLERAVPGSGIDQPPAIEVLALLGGNAQPAEASVAIRASRPGARLQAIAADPLRDMAPAARERRLALGYRRRFGPVAARPTSSLTISAIGRSICCDEQLRSHAAAWLCAGAHRRDYIMLPWHVLNVTIDTQMDT